MKKLIPLIFIIIILFSCGDNDSKLYYLTIENQSDTTITNIFIEMDSLTPCSKTIDNLATGNISEKLKFKFDRTNNDGCSSSTGISLAAAFEGNYTQNDSLRYFFVIMENLESDFISLIIENENYYFIEN